MADTAQTPTLQPTGSGHRAADSIGPELSVVAPVHDEAEAIGPLIDEIVQALDGQIDFEILVVDDGSTDATTDVLLEASRRHDRLRALRHRACRGQSAALVTGIAAARAPWIATLDGDGQNDPRDIAELWRARLDPSRPRMLCGNRVTRRDSVSKRVASRIANAVRDRVLGDGVPDTGCGLKIFERELFQSLPAFDHMHRFLPALARARGATLLTVPVRHRPRATGRSKYGVFDRAAAGVLDLVGVWWLIRRGLWAERPEVEPAWYARARTTPAEPGAVPHVDDDGQSQAAPLPHS